MGSRRSSALVTCGWSHSVAVPVKRRLAEFIRLLPLCSVCGDVFDSLALCHLQDDRTQASGIPYLAHIFWLSIICEANFESIYIYLYFALDSKFHTFRARDLAAQAPW
jgi:hypothetical protein